MIVGLRNYNPSFQRRRDYGNSNGSDSYQQPPRRDGVWVILPNTTYVSVWKKDCKTTRNTDFETRLASVVQNPQCLQKAKVRVAAFSKYLKNMIGFVIPEYTIKGVEKGGYQWFQKGAEYLLRGSKRYASERDFPSIAKELYGLLALHDNYWKSDDFLNYLASLRQTPAIQATQTAVRELKLESTELQSQRRDDEVSFRGWFHGSYFSSLKYSPRLLREGGAYSNRQLGKTTGDIPEDSPQNETIASLDHLMPASWGGPDDDPNFVVCSRETNINRGNIPLLDFLKGKDDEKRRYN
jgi:hypothetical protein